MNIDAEIKAAQERINRSIGQKARYAKAEIRRMVDVALREHEIVDVVPVSDPVRQANYSSWNGVEATNAYMNLPRPVQFWSGWIL